MPSWSSFDSAMMNRAIALARRGEGFVEPNPMVGCVIVGDGVVVGDGWHQRFGGPHAEVEALRAAGGLAAGATMYVSLEPCCHQGKTPPCTEGILAAGVSRVVAAIKDPFPKVAGGGLARLADAGVAVEVGLQEAEARDLNAPYLKLLATGRPWVIAKWAMTLDGKIATRSGASQWISGEASRQVVHRLRGRVDGIIIGRRTAEIDDPLLTARPEGERPRRVATRVVLDSQAKLSSSSNLVRTAKDCPTLIAVGPDALEANVQQLMDAGCEVFTCSAMTHRERLMGVLNELGRRRMTNLLIEGGGVLLGSLLDAGQIDEVHIFIAPKLIGGMNAPSPVGGPGVEKMAEAIALSAPIVEQIGSDLYVHCRVRR
jgi:diaminohydroxyphosphoribosylaminopyrimidine deaminase / 5-amino-6-(5-phosphoribosylamino)uracil reductase